jgi:WD40 repeat protein/formylglycine-generating enzyme required for sulfatase activity
MSWPLSQDYNEAVQNPHLCFADAQLCAGQVATNALGLPMPRSGNFADVYEVRCPLTDGRWAVKCFTRQVPGLRERYAAISAHLRQANLLFTVNFNYLEQGIRIRGQWYPVLKMDWVEGQLLNEFVRASLDKPALLEGLLEVWAKMARRLRGAGMAHGDLQHGNIILVPATKKHAKLAVKLIDYDGMWVPALAGQRSGEVGHPAYQHPQRLREGTYGPEVDRFPVLVIYVATRALLVGGRALWDRYDNGDNLLFREQDLRSPRDSALFWELVRLPDPELRRLVDRLSRAAHKPLDQTPNLEEALSNGTALATPAGPSPVAPVTPGTQVVTVPAPWYAEPQPARLSPSRSPSEKGNAVVRRQRTRRRVRLVVALLAGSVGGVCVLLCGLGFWASSLPTQPTKEPVALARGPGEAGANGSRGVKVPTSAPPAAVVQTTPPQDPKSSPTSEPKPEPTPEPKPGPKREAPPEPKAEREPEPLILQGHTSVVRSVCWSPDGERIASASDDNMVRVCDATSGQEILSFKGHTGFSGINSLCWSPDGKHLASGVGDSSKGEVKVWDAATGQEVHTFKGPGLVLSVCWSPDGKRLASAGSTWDSKQRESQGEVKVWDAASGQEALTFKGHTQQVNCVRWSRDGKRLASASSDFTVKVWDAVAGQEALTCKGRAGPVNSVSWSPDGKRLASAHQDGTMKVWDAVSGARVLILKHGSPVRSVCWSPDGKHIATGSWAYEVKKAGPAHAEITTMWGEVKVWDAATGQETLTFKGHTGPVNSVSWSPDGKRLASASEGGTVKVWNAENGQPIGVTGSPPPGIAGGPPQAGGVRPASLDCTGAAGVSATEVRKAQAAWAKYLGRQVEEEVELAPGVEMTFVLVPPGKFLMGLPAAEQEKAPDEVQHEVTLTRPFYLGKYEVTQAQYEAVVGQEKNQSKFRGPKLPVDSVSWIEAGVYADRLAKKRGDILLYRLPTEAEWEYACRGGRASSQPFGIGSGTSLTSDQANFNGSLPYGSATKGRDWGRVIPVGSYLPNAFGLYDMHGNVWEWCADWYGPYPGGNAVNPTGQAEGFSTKRVLRGGSWKKGGRDCRASTRTQLEPSLRYDDLGFRLARSVKEPEATTEPKPAVSPAPTPGAKPGPQSLKGTLVLEKLPPGARVLLDEEEVIVKRRDNSIAEIVSIDSGTHDLVIRADGYQDYAAKVTIDSHQPLRHTVMMVKVREPEGVNKLIQSGTAHLKSKLNKGRWSLAGSDFPQGDMGASALCGLALLEAGKRGGIAPDDPAILQAAKAVREASLECTGTLSLSLGILFLDRLEDGGDDELIQSMAVRLLAGQDSKYGAWGRECPPIGAQEVERLRRQLGQRAPRVAKNPKGVKERKDFKNLSPEVRRQVNQVIAAQARHDQIVDNFDTHLAILALWVAGRQGIPTQTAAERVSARFRGTQRPDGGWHYSAAIEDQNSTVTMTCAGLLGLAVSFGADPKRPAGPPGDLVATKALELLGTRVGDHPLGNVVTGDSPYFLRDVPYFVWVLEQVCQVYHVQKIAGKEWYALGTKWATDHQNPDGSWPGQFGDAADTALVLLFLERSNLFPDLARQLK